MIEITREPRRIVAVLVIGVLVGVLLGGCMGTPQVSSTPTASTSAASSASPMATPPAAATPPPGPGASAPGPAEREHFTEVMQTGNTQPFEQDFANAVLVILNATECCGVQTTSDAISSLSYVNPGDGSTWNFSLDAATLGTFASSAYGEYFPVNALVGVSSTGYLASFVPGTDGLIVKIFLSITTNL